MAGFPIIVKPKSGSGSRGVVKLNSVSEIDEFRFSAGLIAEEFIEGEEYSVECFSFSGAHKLLAIIEKLLLNSGTGSNFTEMGHSVPAALDAEIQTAIMRYIPQFLDFIGLDNGPSHTEIKISGGAIKIIETHNRIGGDRIASLVKLSTGIDLVELSVLWPLALCAPPENIPFYGGAAIRFFNPPCGRILAVNGKEALQYSPGLIEIEIGCSVGDIIKPITESANRCGFIIAAGKMRKKLWIKPIKLFPPFILSRLKGCESVFAPLTDFLRKAGAQGT